MTVDDLAGVIQMTLAPVFLLAGIAGFLNVMSGRLARTVDRARLVERRLHSLSNSEIRAISQSELEESWSRVRLINLSVWLCTASGALVCLLVVSMFAAAIWKLDLDGIIVSMFIAAMLVLIASLILFLREVMMATRHIRAGREFAEDGESGH